MQASLYMSVFCCKKVWNIVLKRAIAPFIQTLASENIFSNYQLSFNYLSGENIRLTLRCDNTHREELAQKADDHFKHFFSHFQLPQQNVRSLPGNGIFDNFPPNTIQYGLYNDYQTQSTDTGIAFQQQMTKLIIDWLTGDDFDDELLLTFAFYLHMGLLAAFEDYLSKFSKTVNQEFRHHYGNRPSNDLGINDEIFIKKYMEAKPVLLEIMDEVRSCGDKTIAHDLWYNQWKAVCLEEINQQTGISGKSLLTVHFDLKETINSTLGMIANTGFLLDFFIAETWNFQGGG